LNFCLLETSEDLHFIYI